MAPFKDQNYTRLLDDLIAEQAKTWLLNRVVRGSTSEVVVSLRDAAGRPSKIVGKYLFNVRSPGSVTVDFSDGAPECMYFFDFPSTCKTPDRRIVAAYLSGGYQQLEPGIIPRGGVSAANPARVPPPSQPVQPASGGAAAAQAGPAPPSAAGPDRAAATATTPAPAIAAQQQREQQAAEIQKRAQKFTACRATFQQALKDHPEARAERVKEYTSCIQAK